jgi:hypothetical protein
MDKGAMALRPAMHSQQGFQRRAEKKPASLAGFSCLGGASASTLLIALRIPLAILLVLRIGMAALLAARVLIRLALSLLLLARLRLVLLLLFAIGH